MSTTGQDVCPLQVRRDVHYRSGGMSTTGQERCPLQVIFLRTSLDFWDTWGYPGMSLVRSTEKIPVLEYPNTMP